MSKGRRVLAISEIFWPEGGGAELATYLTLRFLRDNNFKITIITGTKKPAVINGIKFHYTSLLGNWDRARRFLYIGLLSRRPWFIRLLRQHDILYIPLQAYSLIPLAKKYGLRVIIHLHNYVPARYYGVKYFFEPDKVDALKELKLSVLHEVYANNSVARVLALPFSYIIYRISKIWLEQADTIICVSRRQAKIIEHQSPNIAKKIKIVYNPLPHLPDIKKEIDNNKRSILYVGGRKYIKGYHILLQAIKEFISVPHIGSHIEFILVGEGLRRFSQLFNTSGVKIKTLGYVPRRHIIMLHKYVRALVFPSICEEPLPYAIIESMLLKTVPIAPRIGGIPEVVSGTKAELFLFEPGNVNSLVKVLKKIVNKDTSELLEIGEEIHYHIVKMASKSRNRLLEIFS